MMKKNLKFYLLILTLVMFWVACDLGNSLEQYYLLSLEVEGPGQILANGGYYEKNTLVALAVQAKTGCKFSHWAGKDGRDVFASGDDWQILMDADKEIVAVFTECQGISARITIEHTWPHPYGKTDQKKFTRQEQKSLASNEIDNDSYEDYIEGQLVVGFSPSLGEEKRMKLLSQAGGRILKSLGAIDAYLIEVEQEELLNLTSTLTREIGVRYVEPNYRVYASEIYPNDPYYQEQWNYEQIRLPQAWTVTRGAPWVRVAVLDTGISSSHPDLQDLIDLTEAYNFYDNNTDVNDGNGHGTHVAGTIGATTNNSAGVAGVMWEGTIIPLRVLNDEGAGSMLDVAEAMLYAAGLHDHLRISEPVHIISMSLGTFQNPQALKDAARAVDEAGVLMVAAAGNNGRGNGQIDNPASYPEVIAVGAVDYNYPDPPSRAPYSSHGYSLDLVAPGGNKEVDSDGNGYEDGILSTDIEASYSYKNGTSMACPHVAGVMGLMLANGLEASAVRDILARTAIDLGD
ncbi:MAG: peptidase S8, partial [Fibrobacter sp.]|nr:peptidase S8 [Fibrobacter sp.]